MNGDPSIHGIIMLMPFPKFVDEARMKRLLAPEKDIDAITDASYANLFDAKRPLNDYFCACTAEACMEILLKNDVELQGKKVTIVGRSVRIGKPLMLMMLNANATVTVCHTRTKPEDLKTACEEADIVILATGQIESYGTGIFPGRTDYRGCRRGNRIGRKDGRRPECQGTDCLRLVGKCGIHTGTGRRGNGDHHPAAAECNEGRKAFL